MNAALFNLADEVGPKPTTELLDIIRQVGEDSIAGNAFNFDRFGPYGFRVYRVDYAPQRAFASPVAPAVIDKTLAALRSRTRRSASKSDHEL